jgi:ComF family protein
VLLCADCERDATLCHARTTLDHVPSFALGEYAGSLKRAIGRFKYQGHPELARDFARALHERAPLALRGCCLVPVPLHPKRLATRGYNQSALVARELAAKSGAQFAPRALRRLKDTSQQAKLDRAQRQLNMQGQFIVRAPPKLPVVLIDDVLTTGSTARSCVTALEAAACRVALVLTLAQSGD